MAKIQWEDRDCRNLWKWAQFFPVLRDHLYHVPNGGARRLIEAGVMKALGVRAGVSDYHLPVPRGTFHGLWIEMKATPPHDAAVQPNQTVWLERMAQQGHAAFVCKGWLQAKAVLEWYTGLPVPEAAGECPTLEEALGGK